jgi:hypothetical protein
MLRFPRLEIANEGNHLRRCITYSFEVSCSFKHKNYVISLDIKCEGEKLS